MTDKTKTVKPLISLVDNGLIHFEIENAGLFLTFDMSVSDAKRAMLRLQELLDMTEVVTEATNNIIEIMEKDYDR